MNQVNEPSLKRSVDDMYRPTPTGGDTKETKKDKESLKVRGNLFDDVRD